MPKSPGYAGLPGGGPWAISAYCSASSHNTLSAVRRIHRKGGGCTCPRANYLADIFRASSGENRKFDVPEPRYRGPKMKVAVAKPIDAQNYPDFTGGACTTVRGQRAALAGMNTESSQAGIHDRERARRLCNAGPCPIRDSICRPWVLTQEQPAGAWGAVWGGLDPWNRRGIELVWDPERRIAVETPFRIEDY